MVFVCSVSGCRRRLSPTLFKAGALPSRSFSVIPPLRHNYTLSALSWSRDSSSWLLSSPCHDYDQGTNVSEVQNSSPLVVKRGQLGGSLNTRFHSTDKEPLPLCAAPSSVKGDIHQTPNSTPASMPCMLSTKLAEYLPISLFSCSRTTPFKAWFDGFPNLAPGKGVHCLQLHSRLLSFTDCAAPDHSVMACSV
jgi:hypothetical protein